jgi:hypothetical protein
MIAQLIRRVIRKVFKEKTMSKESVRTAPRAAALSSTDLAKALFFAAAGVSFLLSVGLWFSGDHERGMFVGIWVPSICSAGALLLAGGGARG